MLRFVLVLLLATAAVWADKDYRYTLFEEFARLGYVSNFQDVDDTTIAVNVNCDPAFYRKNLLRILMGTGWVIDKNQEAQGIGQLTTDWKSKTTDGAAAFFSGVDAYRLRLIFNTQNIGKEWIRVQCQVQCELASDGGTWRMCSDRELRNLAREAVAISLARPIYGDSTGVQTVVQEHAKKEYPMPTREAFNARFGVQTVQEPKPDPVPTLK